MKVGKRYEKNVFVQKEHKMRIKLKGGKKDGLFFPYSRIHCKVREFLKAF